MDEWSTLTIPNAIPSAADRALSEDLGRGDQRLGVEWTVDGARIKSSSWVGMARFSTFEVQVRPKLVGGSLGVLQMIGYASGLEALYLLPQDWRVRAEEYGLADLWCMLLEREATKILAAGPESDYVWSEGPQNALRGRLLILDQVTRHFGAVTELECRFEDYLSDILDNQLVQSGLAAGYRVAASSQLHASLRRARAALDEYCEPMTLDANEAESRLNYTRRNEHYRTAHKLSLLLLRNLYLRDLFAADRQPAVAFFLDMNSLFEQFVTKLVHDALAQDPIGIVPQRSTRSLIVDESTGRTYSRVIPDVLLSSLTSMRQATVDAKYKLYDERSIDPADIYQLFVYAFAFHADNVGIPMAVLLYPASNRSSTGVRLRVQDIAANHPARIAAHPLNVTALLHRIQTKTLVGSPELADVRAALLEALAA
jgi:5-methylcytosine-specific restriction enzyme subunit McrC